MENISLQQFAFNYKSILLDEIALEGLEGICLNLLWKRIEKRISSPVTPKMQKKFWAYIVGFEAISYYKLAEPRPNIQILDRFLLVDMDSGHLLDPPDYLDGPYEYCPTEKEYGSCPSYNTRCLIPKISLQSMAYEEIVAQYGDSLVIVASLEERWKALAPHVPIVHLTQLTQLHFCMLELIGRARHNGQMTIGKTNMAKIVKEPKLLFYNRKNLIALDLIKSQYLSQVTCNKSMKGILLRLKRFHKPKVLSLPKIGRVHNIVTYLLDKPDYSEKNEVMIVKGFMTPLQSKRLQKTINIFCFDDRDIKFDPEASLEEKAKNIFVKKKKYISIAAQSDESSQSDEECSESPVECQYKVGISLLRQAYERFLEAGLKGLTQIEIGQLLGVEFYTSRTICRIFKARNIVKEFLEDRGRQRTARYVLVAATKAIDAEYADAKKKFRELIQLIEEEKQNVKQKVDSSESEEEIPAKKLKTEDKHKDQKELENIITEIKVLDGFEHVKESLLNPKKAPTLRQLRFANGILRVIVDRKFVPGFQALSNIVAKEINEPAMDTKALKLFVQKLVSDECLKIIRLKKPKSHDDYTYLVCSPGLTTTDPIIKAKYKDMCKKAQLVQKQNMQKLTQNISRPLSQFVYPRYRKIQKLHEFITQLVHFNDVKLEGYPPGFASLVAIIPEMTIEFSLGNISNADCVELTQLKLSEQTLALKIRESPSQLRQLILQNKSLQNSLKIGLKVLAVLGLIQLINQPTSITAKEGYLISNIFYVNRRAKIIDTTGRWPRTEMKVIHIEKSYTFESFDDVERYWYDVSTIGMNTTICGVKRERYKLIHPTRNEDTVQEFDNGVRYGDGLGPCGFDSSIFMDVQRLWRAYMFRNPVNLFKKQNKLKAILKKKAKRVSKKKLSKKIKSLPDVPTGAVTGVKTEIIIQDAVLPTPVKTRKRLADAYIVWSEFEDKILMMCSAALTIMSPISQPGSLKIRNIVAKDLLSIYDSKKVASFCHKRSVYLESNSLLTYEKDCIINELRKRTDLIGKYEGLLRVLRLKHYSNMSKYINESRLPMMELIWLVSQVQRTKPYLKTVPSIAICLEEFSQKYTITASSANKAYNIYRTPISADPTFSVLKEGIILSIMLSHNGPVEKDTAMKIYVMFKSYDEAVLRSAIEQLRKTGAIAARDKILNGHLSKVNFDDLVQSSYKISVGYRRKWIGRLESDFVENIGDLLYSEMPQSGLRGSSELNCVFCELSACDVLDVVSDTIPVVSGSVHSIIQEEQMNVIDMETKYKLKSGLVGWKNKRNIREFAEVYKKIDYESILNTLVNDAVVDFSTVNHNLNLHDDIISYLNEKGESGCTFSELQVLHKSSILDRLQELEARKIIKLVGLYENRIVLTKFSKPYLLQVKPNICVLPTPWQDLEKGIHYEIILKWAGVIMNKVFECPGCSIGLISSSFEFITTRAVQDVCRFLEKCECITLKNISKKSVDLFSDNDDEIPEFNTFNRYDSPENILVFPLKNSLTNYANVRRLMLI